MKKLSTLIFAFICSFSFLSAQIYVDASATGTGDGTSWENAFTEIYEALAIASSGDEVWAAAGVYAGGDDSELTPTYFGDFKLFGGFLGGETTLDERDAEANLVVITGDLNGDDIVGNLVDNREDNMRHIFFLTQFITNATIIDGITFRGGHTDDVTSGGDDRRGGAILSYGAPIIQNCTFEENFGWFGGAIYPRFGDANGIQIMNCDFRNNGGGNGGAIYINSVNDYFFSNLTFEDNLSVNNAGGIYLQNSIGTVTGCYFARNETGVDDRGGAMYILIGENIIDNCTFEDNLATRTGGAIHIAGDTARVSSTVFETCFFNNNESLGWGGAVTAYDSLQTTSFVDCNFSGNTCAQSGGGISTGFATSTNISQSTFFENSAGSSGGGVFAQNSDTQLTIGQCEFTDNVAATTGGGVSAGSGQQTIISESVFSFNVAETGGAVHTNDDTLDVATLLLFNSTFLTNSADNQAGALNFVDTDVTSVNSVISSNFAFGNGTGGAISANFTFGQNDTVNLINNSILDNSGTLSGGIASWTETSDGTSPGVVRLINTVVKNFGDNYAIEEGAPEITSEGGNLFSDDISALMSAVDITDIFNADPLIGNDYYPQEGSPCINKGVDHPWTSTHDFQGLPRVGKIDKGAGEYQTLVNTDEINIQDKNLSIQPNPAIDHIQLDNNLEVSQVADLLVLSAHGQISVLQSNVLLQKDQQITLNVSELVAGNYTLIAKGEENIVGRVKLVKVE